MIKNLIHTVLAFTALSVLLASCHDEEWQGGTAARDGYVTLHFGANIPVMQEVITRAVDYDGGGVQNMTLFCFDTYGLFITTTTATLADEKPSTTGSFTAEVPDNTRAIHFVANQNMTEFKEDQFRNHSEAEVMAQLEGSSGKMIYWARFACDEDNTAKINVQIASKNSGKITLIRNHAMISVLNPDLTDENDTSVSDEKRNTWLQVTGLAVCNISAFGTVAPYHPEKGFDFAWPDDYNTVTLPQKDAKMSDVTMTDGVTAEYVFESENRADDPVSVIIRGHRSGETEADDLYYRVMLIDEKGDQLLIQRNHNYRLHIQGELSFGQPTMEQALEATATNNVWISISDEVHVVEDGSYILTVEQTSYVLSEEEAGKALTLGVAYTYTLEGKNGTKVTAADKPEVTWLDNQVAGSSLQNYFEVDTTTGIGTGKVLISLLDLGDNQKLEGTLLVKKGLLQRKIKVVTVKKQSFAPSWVGTQVYGDLAAGRPHVTAMFTIPETCPEELFPMQVLLSVNDLDVRYESGMKLSIIREGEEGYGEPNGIGYKYVYTVEGPGVQRIYFESILTQTAGEVQTLTIEADHFATMTRTFTFSDSQKAITVTGLSTYNVSAGGSDQTGEYADDEVIFYRLVPQKKGANVQFNLQLLTKPSDDVEDVGKGEAFDAGAKDEFLLYSQNLDYYTDTQENYDKAGVSGFDCTFYPTESDTWWRANNENGGRMLMFQPNDPEHAAGSTDVGKYSIYMYTTRAVSAEVVRIASNQSGSPAVRSENEGDDGNYGGNSYRSVTFELANYNPFRFSARVNGVGEDDEVTGDAAEKVTPLSWTYKPGQEVDIEIDVTSFAGTDGKSADPFGEAFEIYIDAPMLAITTDENRLKECNLNSDKLKADPTVPGRFIYTVDANRDTERDYGTGEALKKDEYATSQKGERKTFPFVTSSVVSAGDIVISSNKEQVVFFDKMFSVTNTSIKGSLTYKKATGEEVEVLAGSFVSFERVNNNSRIGAITVTADGTYELRLRKGYDFNWYTDEVELFYEDKEGNIYYQTFESLAYLFANPDIVLAQKNSGTESGEGGTNP